MYVLISLYVNSSSTLFIVLIKSQWYLIFVSLSIRNKEYFYSSIFFKTGFTPVTECPKSQREIREASDRLRCGNDINGNSQYLCSRFYEENFLVEFCYDGEMGMIEKGTPC